MKPPPLRLLSWEELKDSRSLFEQRLPSFFPWFLAGLALLLVIGLTWAIFGELDVVVRGQALLRPVQSMSEIRAPETGQVVEKSWVSGQKISAGTLLWRLDRREGQSELNAVLSQIARTQKELADWEHVRFVYERVSEVPTGSQSPSPEARRLAELFRQEDERLGLLETQARLAWEREVSLPISAQAASRIQDLDTSYRLAKAARRGFRLERQQGALDRLQALRRSLEDLGSRQKALERSLAAAEARSPLDGWVEEARRFNVGDIVLAGELLARVVPESARDLRVEIAVNSADMAEVQRGQTFRLAFPKLAPANFGYLTGVLETVPEDAWLRPDGPPVYQLIGRLDRTWMEDSRGRRIALRAGMTAEARIRLRTQPIWRFLLEKLDFLQ